jgi:hypothetical protein
MRATFQRIGERVPEFARRHTFSHFAMLISWREPSYRVARERCVVDFIQSRTSATKV